MPTPRPTPPLPAWRACALAAFALAALASAQEGGDLPGGPPPGSPESPPRGDLRQQMWPAPTAEDWAKPCLLTWQRTWEDAVAVAKETGRPILVCINMDGEIASEHYAGVRYRSPEIAALYEPYVTVIASVYRHTPRDHDDQGRRIPCPRFGGVTCGEHIAIEPTIFAKFCNGQRVAPRHICVELDGKESYDVFYANDTASVFQTIRNGLSERPPFPPNVVRGDRPIAERVQSRDVRDRLAVEGAYRDGDAAQKASLLDAALKHPEAAPIDLLRLAVFGLDVDAGKAARAALAEVQTPDAARLISDALRMPMDDAERQRLIATLKRLGESSDLARWLAVVSEGLTGGSASVDVKGWSEALEKGTYSAPAVWLESAGLATRIESTAAAAEAKPEDPTTRLDLAEASLALAVRDPAAIGGVRMAAGFARRLCGDAARIAREAERLGAKGWRVDAVIALADYHAGDVAGAYERAAAAVKSLPAGDTSWPSMAVVTVFAESRWMAIKEAVRKQERWPSDWLKDLHAAYSLLLRHPLGTDTQAAWHCDVLEWIGADHRMGQVLRAGVERFPTSDPLHQRLRDRLLKEGGPERLESAYAAMLEGPGDRSALVTFAGDASVVAAEHLRRGREYAKAMDAYARAIALYTRALDADPSIRESADRDIALALAGRARVAFQLGEDERALEEILASIARAPPEAGTRDAMGITPGETAQMLLARLKETKRDEAAARLEAALGKLDPDLLRPTDE